MKIKCVRQLGATLIIVFLALVVIAIGGTFIYHLRKWAKRVHDNNPPPPPYTNSSEFSVPPGYNYTSIDIYPIMHWWLEVPEQPALAQTKNQSTQPRTVHVGLTNGLLVLTPVNASNWVTLDLSTNFDVNNFPVSFNYNPLENNVSIEQSPDGSNWVKLMELTAPSIFRDDSPSERIFYRAKFIQ